jgi:transcriptional regulator with PAS, ATPase and Fis domain
MLGRNHRDLVKEGMVAKSSAVVVVETKKPTTIIHEYPPTSRKALVTSIPMFDNEENISMIVSSIRDVTELTELKTQLEQQKKNAEEYQRKLEVIRKQIVNSEGLIAEDKRMLFTISLVNRVTQVDSTVLLTGETGVGKEEIAKYIHTQSPRKNKPFVVVNCGAIPRNLFESELFGYEGGAFTGARREGKIGLIEAADAGTLFLDEIGELPYDIQVKLLRAIQEKQIQRVGGIKQIHVDIRIISATNKNLLEMVQDNKFREDLYYRICIVPIEIPSLRDRVDDIIPLINYFLAANNKKYNTNKIISGMGYQVMFNYTWPGNVRELKSVIERLVVMTDSDIITASDLPMYQEFYRETNAIKDDMPLAERLERIEFTYITEAYQKFKSTRKAAKQLGMSLATFIRKKKEYSSKYNDIK